MAEALTSGSGAFLGVCLLVLGVVWFVLVSSPRLLVFVLGWIVVMYFLYPVILEVLLAHLQRLW